VKILDLYIIKRFLLTFVFILALIMSIAIIFDVSEQIDDLIRTKAPLKGILWDYYKNFVLFYGNLFSPLLTFLAVIFFTSQLANRTEIVAILSGLLFAVPAYRLHQTLDMKHARTLMFASFAYLPIVQLAFVLDKI